jgi:uncharacterized protein with PQ loop repeat
MTNRNRAIDTVAYGMGIMTVAVNIPQLIAVWSAPTLTGVSLVSWCGFLLASGFWLFYGVTHREKPLIVVNGALLLVQAAIVAGIVIRS